MFFKFIEDILEDKNEQKIYSFGLVEDVISIKTYRIEFNNHFCIIISDETLRKGEWIKFIGRMKEGILNAEYIEKFYGEVNVIIRCLNRIRSDSKKLKLNEN